VWRKVLEKCAHVAKNPLCSNSYNVKYSYHDSRAELFTILFVVITDIMSEQINFIDRPVL
jgi:hypothetical protein